MAPEWEMAMGVELGMGMGTYSNGSTSVVAPMNGNSCFLPAAHLFGVPPSDALRVDDLLDLSNAGHEFFPSASAAAAAGDNGNFVAITEPSVTTASASSSDHQTPFQLSFADEFYIPSEEAAELEWLSKFVEESYSDVPNYPSAAHAAMAAAATSAGNTGSNAAGPDNSTAAPGRGARSKRSRATAAAAAAWHSLIPRPPSQSSPSSSSSSSDFPSSKPARANNSHVGNGGSRGKKNAGGGSGGGGEAVGMEGGVRRCTHCGSEKTPQWRTGPLGPKTLCNACGVRYKSGRLMPEYRPAASPTFVLTQHSNSHRKVMELRRQKELLLLRGGHRGDAAAASAAAAGSAAAAAAAAGRPELLFRDYGVC